MLSKLISKFSFAIFFKLFTLFLCFFILYKYPSFYDILTLLYEVVPWYVFLSGFHWWTTVCHYIQIIETNWESLINHELDVNNACSNFTDAFLTIAKEYIPTREVTIQKDDKMWFDSNLRWFCRKTVQKQRNRVNNLKKQAQ